MASKLLQTLETIENGRQACVRAAQEAGLPVDNTATLTDIASTIGLCRAEYLTWSKPNDWYNLEDEIQAFINSELNTNKYNCIFAASFRGDDSSLIIPYNSSMQYHAFYLSDGTLIDAPTEDIEHTWDTSKDKILTNGEIQRYILCLGRNNLAYLQNSTQIQTLITSLKYIHEFHISNWNWNTTSGRSLTSLAVPIISWTSSDKTDKTFAFHTSNSSARKMSFTTDATTCMENIELPNCVEFGESSNIFTNLRRLELPNAQILGDVRAPILEVLILPSVHTLKAGADAYGTLQHLKIFQTPQLTTINFSGGSSGDTAFKGLTSVEQLNWSKVTTIHTYAGKRFCAKEVLLDSLASCTSGSSGSLGNSSVSIGVDVPTEHLSIGPMPNNTISINKAIRINYDRPNSLLAQNVSLANITTDDVKYVINALQDVTNLNTTHTLTLSTNMRARPGIEDCIAMATSKGWEVK